MAVIAAVLAVVVTAVTICPSRVGERGERQDSQECGDSDFFHLISLWFGRVMDQDVGPLRLTRHLAMPTFRA